MILTKETISALTSEVFGGSREVIEYQNAIIVRFDIQSELSFSSLRKFHEKLNCEFFVSSSSEINYGIGGSDSWIEIEIPR